MYNPRDEWIMLNVGGQIFTTTRTTLCSIEPNSMLARMFSQPTHLQRDSEDVSSGLMPSPKDSSGAYLIDRSPRYFEPILNYLRHGKLIIDHNVNVQGVLEEAKFFGIMSLLPQLELETERMSKKKTIDLYDAGLLNLNDDNLDDQQQQLDNGGYVKQHHITANSDPTQQETITTTNNNNTNFNNNNNYYISNINSLPNITRKDVIKALIRTPKGSELLRFRGVNLSGANLSNLDLSHINFQYADLSNCNLKGADLSFANLYRANLSHSNLEGSKIQSTSFERANLSNSNMRAIDGPRGLGGRPRDVNRFDWANMVNCNLEASQLAYSDFTGANLKGSNLQNCDLSSSAVNGATFENCDLTTANTAMINFHGAKLKGAQLPAIEEQ